MIGKTWAGLFYFQWNVHWSEMCWKFFLIRTKMFMDVETFSHLFLNWLVLLEAYLFPESPKQHSILLIVN